MCGLTADTMRVGEAIDRLLNKERRTVKCQLSPHAFCATKQFWVFAAKHREIEKKRPALLQAANQLLKMKKARARNNPAQRLEMQQAVPAAKAKAKAKPKAKGGPGGDPDGHDYDDGLKARGKKKYPYVPDALDTRGNQSARLRVLEKKAADLFKERWEWADKMKEKSKVGSVTAPNFASSAS